MNSRVYECVFLASGSVSDSAALNLINGFSSTFKENGIKILKQENWGAISLAYKIKKCSKAYYFMFAVSCEHTKMTAFKDKLKYNELIIRHFIQQKKKSDLYINQDGISLKMLKNPAKDRRNINAFEA